MPANEFDIIIVGGGPAGATAGTLLAQAGLTVVILEKSTFPRFKIGESLLPSGNRALRRSGVWPAVERAGFLRKYGAEFTTPGNQHTVHNVFNKGLLGDCDYAYEVERSRFDALLLNHAQANGCEVIQEATAGAAQETEAGWTVEVTQGGQQSTIRGKWLIDAGGRACWLARQLAIPRTALPYPRRIAIYNHFSGVPLQPGERAGNIIITRLPDGWFWTIPLSGERTSVGYVSTLDAYKHAVREPEAFFREAVEKTPCQQQRLAASEPIADWQTTADYSYEYARFCGLRYFLCGDAAAFIDPVFSSGVYLALESATAAVDAILAAIRVGKSTLPNRHQHRYTAPLKKRIAVIRRLVENFYDDDGFAVFMNPRDQFQLFAAVNSIVAGNTHEPWPLRWRYGVFNAICALNRRWHFVPRIDLSSGPRPTHSPPE